jgi:predicted DCC family thiol-disulfide oxidoreductase YuxK
MTSPRTTTATDDATAGRAEGVEATPAIVLFDRDCGLCRWTAERLRRWDRGRRLAFVPLGTPLADALLPHLTPGARLASWHLAIADGRVRSGGAAVPDVLELLPGGRPLAAAARRLPGPTDRVYGWVADHRSVLGRLLGRRACAVDPSARRPVP